MHPVDAPRVLRRCTIGMLRIRRQDKQLPPLHGLDLASADAVPAGALLAEHHNISPAAFRPGAVMVKGLGKIADVGGIQGSDQGMLPMLLQKGRRNHNQLLGGKAFLFLNRVGFHKIIMNIRRFPCQHKGLWEFQNRI
ncbi:hypothetical protein D3C76_1247460 [compost metagenome]